MIDPLEIPTFLDRRRDPPAPPIEAPAPIAPALPRSARDRYRARADREAAYSAAFTTLRRGPMTLRSMERAHPDLPRRALRSALRRLMRQHIVALTGKTYRRIK